MIKPSNDQSEADWIQISSNFRALRGAGRWCVNPRSVLCGVGPTCEDWASSPEPPPRAQKAGVRQSGGVPWKAAADSSLQACITAPQAHLSRYPWACSLNPWVYFCELTKERGWNGVSGDLGNPRSKDLKWLIVLKKMEQFRDRRPWNIKMNMVQVRWATWIEKRLCRDMLVGKTWRSNRPMQGTRIATDGDWELYY